MVPLSPARYRRIRRPRSDFEMIVHYILKDNNELCIGGEDLCHWHASRRGPSKAGTGKQHGPELPPTTIRDDAGYVVGVIFIF